MKHQYSVFPIFMALLSLFFFPMSASADIVEDASKRVAEAGVIYEDATKYISEVQEDIEAHEKKISDLKADIEKQKEATAASIRTAYKLGINSRPWLEFLLGTSSMDELMSTARYIDAVQEANEDEMYKLINLSETLDTYETTLSKEKKEAEAAEAKAKKAVEDAEAARKVAIEEKAKQEREGVASTPDGAASIESCSGETVVERVVPGLNGITVSNDRDTFVAEWSQRIDRYLAGSPLAGYGYAFAEAAFDYGVDPRWSPAISNTESTKGRYCFRSHNAWGWGNSSWPDWDTAIRAHIRGLARGYGYTITPAAAQKYCPPTWDSWYETTLAQMNRI